MHQVTWADLVHDGGMAHDMIPIQSIDSASAAGCGACMRTSVGPVCRVEFGQACASPELHGPEDELQRVLRGLKQALSAQAEDAERLVRSLRLADGEAELVLAVAPHCAAAQLIDLAFQTLRHLLPDTDIYVRHAT